MAWQSAIRTFARTRIARARRIGGLTGRSSRLAELATPLEDVADVRPAVPVRRHERRAEARLQPELQVVALGAVVHRLEQREPLPRKGDRVVVGAETLRDLGRPTVERGGPVGDPGVGVVGGDLRRDVVEGRRGAPAAGPPRRVGGAAAGEARTSSRRRPRGSCRGRSRTCRHPVPGRGAARAALRSRPPSWLRRRRRRPGPRPARTRGRPWPRRRRDRGLVPSAARAGPR